MVSASFFNTKAQDAAIKQAWVDSGRDEKDFGAAYTKARCWSLVGKITLCVGAVMGALSVVFAGLAVSALVPVIGAPVAIPLAIISGLCGVSALILGYKWYRDCENHSSASLGISLAHVEVSQPAPTAAAAAEVKK